jgi:nitrate reductase alpha subunit
MNNIYAISIFSAEAMNRIIKIEADDNEMRNFLRDKINSVLKYFSPFVSIDYCFESLKEYLPSHIYKLKLGRGGNHIWISNEENQRLAIIEFRPLY